ncbi:ras gtpase [Diaporthe amygdali]|uniref:ras gtpase n=1 Tax=Phomopsis amygdali TaxID=1214568 RepID=UPI0022FE64FD|nr:ras gtpase [Diaporthe amygdali]KAJ0121446.1 ras gtpase [Diaporthe amygdali]
MPSNLKQPGSQPPNAHYIFPSSQGLDRCAILVSGDEDRYTGRNRIVAATRLTLTPASRTNGKASSVPSAESGIRTSQPPGTTDIELMDAPPSWHRSASMLEYHVKYAHGFFLVFNMSSLGTLELVKEMLDAMMHAAAARGLVGGENGPVSVPVVLIGNIDENLRRPEDDRKEGSASPRAEDRSTSMSVRAEAEMLADRWGCELLEVDTSSGNILGDGADQAFSALLQRIAGARRPRGSGVAYGFGEMKPPQRLLVRRTMSRILPEALLRLFAK